MVRGRPCFGVHQLVIILVFLLWPRPLLQKHHHACNSCSCCCYCYICHCRHCCSRRRQQLQPLPLPLPLLLFLLLLLLLLLLLPLLLPLLLMLLLLLLRIHRATENPSTIRSSPSWMGTILHHFTSPKYCHYHYWSHIR